MTVVPCLERRRPSRRSHPARVAGRDREAPRVRRDDEARAVRRRARQNRATAGRGDDTTRRRDRVRAPGCGPGLEGHRREPARGSWDVAQWAGSGRTQVARKDRASCGLDNSNEASLHPSTLLVTNVLIIALVAVRFVCESSVARDRRSFLFCRENPPGPIVRTTSRT